MAPLAYRPRMAAVGGGYPILEYGKLIGGIGISSGTYQQDQDACVEALEKIGFQLPAWQSSCRKGTTARTGG